MIEILEGGNIWLNVIFLCLALLGLVATIVAYFKARSIKRCNFNRKDFNLIGPKITSLEKLAFKYDQKSITNLTSTSIAIWNSGTEVINKADFASTDFLRILNNDTFEILEYKIIYLHNKANCYKLIQGSSEITIDFEFMAPNEGIVIQLYHTGLNNKDIKIRGLIKGGGQVLENEQIADQYVTKGWGFMFGWIILIIRRIFSNEKTARTIGKLILFPLVIVTIPVTIILVLYGNIILFLNPIPKEYSLENLNTTDNNR